MLASLWILDSEISLMSVYNALIRAAQRRTRWGKAPATCTMSVCFLTLYFMNSFCTNAVNTQLNESKSKYLCLENIVWLLDFVQFSYHIKVVVSQIKFVSYSGDAIKSKITTKRIVHTFKLNFSLGLQHRVWIVIKGNKFDFYAKANIPMKIKSSWHLFSLSGSLYSIWPPLRAQERFNAV